MGRRRNKKNKDAACQPEAPDSKFSFSLPQIIPPETFKAIAEYMLQLPAPQRNVFLTAKEYSMEYVNPTHIRTKDSPTHMVVFCLRLIMSDHFSPIGVVQINKRVDYVKKLAVVWKAFIQDLSILRLFVIASMSPCTLIFHEILAELTQNLNLEDNTGPITYSVWPYREILHLYDYYSLIEEFQDAFYDRIEVFFLTRQPPSEKLDKESNSLQLYCASWNDIQLTTTVSFDVEDYQMEPNDLIFNKGFRNAYRAISKEGILSTKTRSSTDRLLDLLWQYVDITFTNVNLNPYALQELYDKHEDFRIALATAQFRWYVIEVSNIDKSSADSKACATDPKLYSSTVSNQVFFESGDSRACDTLLSDQNSIKSGSSIELNDNEINNLIDVINNTPGDNVGNLSNEDTFDKFLRKIAFDDYDLYIKTSPIVECTVAQSAEEQKHIASRAERALMHDHDYFSAPAPEIQSESETSKMLKDYFGNLKQKHKKLVHDCPDSHVHHKDCQDSNIIVGNKTHNVSFKANENINKNCQINADNNNYASNQSANRTPYRGLKLIPYGKPAMNPQNCNNDGFNVSYFQANEGSVEDSSENAIKNAYSLSNIVQNIFNNKHQERTSLDSLKMIEVKNTINATVSNSPAEYDKRTDSHRSKNELNSNYHWECSQSSKTIDGLDLANWDTRVLSSETGSVMDSPLYHCSYENGLDIEELAKDEAITKSLDSLAELINTFDVDNQITEYPSKYIILKSTIKKTGEANIPTTDKLEKWSEPVNSLKSSKSDSVLYVKKNLNEPVNSLMPRNVWKQQRNIYNIFMNYRHKLKSPVEELKDLMKSIPTLDVYNQSANKERGSDNNKYSSNKSENCHKISTNDTTFLNKERAETKKIPLVDDAAATPEMGSSEKSFHSKNTREVVEIDYQNYRKNLVSVLYDHKKTKCDTFRDKDTFDTLYSAIPPEAEIVRVTNDWLCTFKGYLKLKEILERRRVKFVRSKLLCLDHIDFFVALIKKLKNNILSTVYEGPGYKFVDYKSAFDMLYSGDGVYILTQDQDVIISL